MAASEAFADLLSDLEGEEEAGKQATEQLPADPADEAEEGVSEQEDGDEKDPFEEVRRKMTEREEKRSGPRRKLDPTPAPPTEEELAAMEAERQQSLHEQQQVLTKRLTERQAERDRKLAEQREKRRQRKQEQSEKAEKKRAEEERMKKKLAEDSSAKKGTFRSGDAERLLRPSAYSKRSSLSVSSRSSKKRSKSDAFSRRNSRGARSVESGATSLRSRTTGTSRRRKDMSSPVSDGPSASKKKGQPRGRKGSSRLRAEHSHERSLSMGGLRTFAKQASVEVENERRMAKKKRTQRKKKSTDMLDSSSSPRSPKKQQSSSVRKKKTTTTGVSSISSKKKKKLGSRKRPRPVLRTGESVLNHICDEDRSLDYERIDGLLERYSSEMDKLDRGKSTVFHWTVRRNDLRLLEIVIRYAKQKHYLMVNSMKMSPLMIAVCLTSNPEALRMILNNPRGYQSDLNLINLNGRTALIHACFHNYDEMVEELLKQRPLPDLEIADKAKKTALYWALNRGNGDIAAKLMSVGASFNITDTSGRKAVDIAKGPCKTLLMDELYRFALQGLGESDFVQNYHCPPELVRLVADHAYGPRDFSSKKHKKMGKKKRRG